MGTFIAICGGGALLAFIQFLISRHDNRKDAIKGIKEDLNSIRKDIKSLDEKGDRREAENRRVRILRFEDELQENKRHSKESFYQVLNDITCYNEYCEKHPDFLNERTVATIAHIKAVYSERLEKHDFA